MALILRGGLARVSGHERDAAHLLRRAKTACADTGMALHAAACAHALGELLGGDAGAALFDEAGLLLAEGHRPHELPVGLFRVILPSPR